MRWTEGLLVPGRVWLRATCGRAGARAARLLYRQRRHRALAWVASEGRSLALTYGIGRRCEPPVDGFDELCDLVGVAPAGAAAIHSWLADRVVLYIVGRPASLVVKVGARRDAGLATETELLGRLNGAASPVIAPKVRWNGAWREHLVLATEAIRLSDSQLDVSLEQAAGTATALSTGCSGVGPLVHGDLSPWNLLRTPSGLALVDWEEGRTGCEPLYDLAHFVVMRSALLQRESPERAMSLLTAPGSPGWRHLKALDVDPSTAPSLLEDYLERTWEHNEASWEYRKALLHGLRIAATGRLVSPAGRSPARARTESTGAAPQ